MNPFTGYSLPVTVGRGAIGVSITTAAIAGRW
jgi:hypothetical protein